MKIEIGKSYKNRKGKGPIKIIGPSEGMSYHHPFLGDNGETYGENGVWDNIGKSTAPELDLVEEWVEPEAKAAEPQQVSNATMVGDAAPANDNSEQAEESKGEPSIIGGMAVRLEINRVQSHSIRSIACELILMGDDAVGCLLIKREAELEKRLTKAA